jgi:four helix bundle protein
MLISQEVLSARLLLICRRMTRGVERFTDLRAWQSCDVFKNAVYRLCENKQIAEDFARRQQIEESASRTTAHIAEGFGRFNPADFARFCVIARSSLMESQSHLLDFVDKRYITEQVRLEVDQLAETALEEVTGLMEYPQSPEALRNARRARERRIASRPQRRSVNTRRSANAESRTMKNTEARTRTNGEVRTSTNTEARTRKAPPRTQNRTQNPEPNRENEHEQRTENPEG